MTHRLYTAKQPLIIAHRGASAYAPENTLAAFRLAVEQGADGVELDAKLSTDGQVVVIHDAGLERTTGTRGRVKNLTLAELRRLDAGSHFSGAFKGEKIPTLAEVFEAVGGKCLINIEITNYTTPCDDLVDKVAALVRQYGLEDTVFYTSFYPANLRRARQVLPEAPVGVLALSGPAGWLSRGYVGQQAAPGMVLPCYQDCNADYVRRQTSAGRLVIPWTVDDAGEAGRLLAAGVNGIITNDPLRMRRAIQGGGVD